MSHGLILAGKVDSMFKIENRTGHSLHRNSGANAVPGRELDYGGLILHVVLEKDGRERRHEYIRGRFLAYYERVEVGDVQRVRDVRLR